MRGPTTVPPKNVAHACALTTLLWPIAVLGASTLASRTVLAADASHQTWTQVTLHKALDAKWLLYFDANGRFYDDFDAAQVLLRPGIARRLTDTLTVYLAYAWTPAWSDDGDLTDEHRIWQQLAFSPARLGAAAFYSRTRVEERFRSDSTVGLRFRQLGRVIFRFGGRMGLSAWDEIFVDLNAATDASGARWQRLGLRQNRFFIGPTVDLTNAARLELGYMNQYVDTTTIDQLRHIVALNAFWDF